ncbi:MAG TPA: hypothetical protein VJM50_17675 [Pyrinomonadaceae bacterium]|nr:hypothetical protein [Pyrinomonadaceae bacterium]
MEKDVVGAPELELIQQALAVRFGTIVSVASIARTLADHGALLGHPEILLADLKWRERTSLLTPEDLKFENLDAATALIEKLEGLRQNFREDQPMLEHLRQSVQQIKNELDVLAASVRAGQNILAQEVGQWLAIWLQNPKIFPEWLALRRETPEFRERFLTGLQD